MECFKRSSSDHFNIGIGVDDPETGFDTDTAPFKKVRSPHGSGFRAK